MRQPQFPDERKLKEVLIPMIFQGEQLNSNLSLSDRQKMSEGTFPKEVVTCHINGGGEYKVFCKYASTELFKTYGHRGGVEYEAYVYRELLDSLQLTSPKLLGTYSNETAGEVWLILEYLDGSLRVGKSPGSEAMTLAAKWIGEFQYIGKDKLQRNEISFLGKYTDEYYAGWVHRVVEFSGHLNDQFSWLEILLERFDEVVGILQSQGPTVIHGEYYSKNILLYKGDIYPVDWESAAIGCGEIDLASLTERWSQDVTSACETAYIEARYPNGPPDEFNRILDAASLYLNLRWLGDRREWTTNENFLWRFELLEEIGQRLDLF